jgi:Flp pilus assembly protein TadG
MKRFLRELCNRLQRLRTAERGNIAVIFALALVPLMTGLGAAVDYSRANATKEAVQAALDSALLAGAKDGSSTWTTLAANVFNSNLALKQFTVPTPAFTKKEDVFYAGSVTASIPTALLGIV